MDLRAAVRDPWVWGQGVLFLAVGVGVPRFAPHLGPATTGPRAVGILLLAAGAWIAVAAMRALGRGLTPGTAPIPGAPLVTTGPYARVRHPIYSGVASLLTGYALCWGRWLPGVLVAAAALLYFREKARSEERKLAASHPGYPGYRARVPMLLPWPRPRP